MAEEEVSISIVADKKPAITTDSLLSEKPSLSRHVGKSSNCLKDQVSRIDNLRWLGLVVGHLEIDQITVRSLLKKKRVCWLCGRPCVDL